MDGPRRHLAARALVLFAIFEDGFPPRSPWHYSALFSVAQTALFVAA
jgi:hypothetical protein